MEHKLNDRVKYFNNAKRIVIKVGTSTLTHENTGKLNISRIEKLCREMADLYNQGREIVLVTSGAIGVGRARCGLTKKSSNIPEKQALAAIGQGILMHLYEKMFSEYGIIVAQVLLTRGDIADRERYLNAREALEKMLQMKVIPIINENDTVAVDDINFGDNDLLSALVASLLETEVLVLLTDKNGLYDSDPRCNNNAELVSRVEEINGDIMESAGGTGSSVGTGGMVTKLQAARIAMRSGIATVIANGSRDSVLHHLFSGEEIGTLFIPSNEKIDSRKRWIAFAHGISGAVVIDDGAVKAIINQGKSLLPSGILEVRGDFERGSSVDILDVNDTLIARGVCNYSSRDIDRLKNQKTTSINKILGYKYCDEIVHRDNLVLLK